MDDGQPRFAGLPERVDVGGDLVLRRYNADDIPHLVDVVNANLDHLAPWMPWAGAPVTVASQNEWFTASQRSWDEGTDFVYGMFDGAGRIIGGTGFHVRNGPGVLEVGYWVSAEREGRGLVTRATQALIDVARMVDGVTTVEIHCDEANHRSASVPKRLGFRLGRVADVPAHAPAETGRQQIWVLDLAATERQLTT